MAVSIAELLHIETVEEADALLKAGGEMYEWTVPLLSATIGDAQSKELQRTAFCGMLLEAAGVLAKEELEARNG